MIFMIISIVVISLVGTIAHFMYDISKHNKVIGLFTAVNESTWEHIKITLTPTIFWSLIDGLIYGNNSNYFIAKFSSLGVLIILIPILYYGHKILLKKEIFILDIINFYIVIICSQLVFHYILDLDSLDFVYSYLSCIGIFIIFGGYMIHTLMPPKNFMFKDPLTNKYGFKGHTEINKDK